MVGWRTEDWFAVVQVVIDGTASHQGENSGVEQSQEHGGSEEGHHCDNGHWAHDTNGGTFFGDFSDHQDKEEAVSDYDGDLSNQDEHLSQKVGPCELKHVLKVKQETIPGR